MRSNLIKAGLAAILVSGSFGAAYAAPVTSLVEHEALIMQGVSHVEIPGKNTEYGSMARQSAANQSMRHNPLHHEVWLNNS
ncbi:MAG: hypothetical protein QM744_14040 [Mesorhizobium sp.]